MTRRPKRKLATGRPVDLREHWWRPEHFRPHLTPEKIAQQAGEAMALAVAAGTPEALAPLPERVA